MGYKFGIDARYKQKPPPGFWRGFFLFDDFNKTTREGSGSPGKERQEHLKNSRVNLDDYIVQSP